MSGYRTRGIAAACLVTALLCFTAGGFYFRETGREIREMERISASNSIYRYVESMKTYGSNLQTLTFEKDDPVYSYKLHESLGKLKTGAESLEGGAAAGVLTDNLAQSFKELSRQLSNFTYRFIDEYPYQSVDMDADALDMARKIMRTAGIIDSVLEDPGAEPWTRNPTDREDWLVDKGYRIDGENSEEVLTAIRDLLEENEKTIRDMWEQPKGEKSGTERLQ